MAIKKPPPDLLSLPLFAEVLPLEPPVEDTPEVTQEVAPEVVPEETPEPQVSTKPIYNPVRGEASRQFIIRAFQSFRSKHWMFDVFRDFCEIAALTLSNSCDRTHWDEREKRYLEIVKRYDKDELDKFVQIFASLQTALEFLGPQDVLGQVFHLLEINNKDAGQFFTPQSVSDLMGMITFCGLEDYIKEKGYVTLQEPAVGGGSTIFGICKAMLEKGFNYQQQLHVTAIDLDSRCAHMAYTQMSLLGIPGIVYHGNTLSLEMFSTWYTPFHCLYGWDWRLRSAKEDTAA